MEYSIVYFQPSSVQLVKKVDRNAKLRATTGRGVGTVRVLKADSHVAGDRIRIRWMTNCLIFIKK